MTFVFLLPSLFWFPIHIFFKKLPPISPPNFIEISFLSFKKVVKQRGGRDLYVFIHDSFLCCRWSVLIFWMILQLLDMVFLKNSELPFSWPNETKDGQYVLLSHKLRNKKTYRETFKPNKLKGQIKSKFWVSLQYWLQRLLRSPSLAFLPSS